MLPPVHVEQFDTIDSTSLHARRMIEVGGGSLPGDRPRLIVARRQTAGRGRVGRPWTSPEGGLWCTLIWPMPAVSSGVVNGLGLRVGLACAMAVEHALAQTDTPAARVAASGVRLKWPNDVLIHGRKVLGVLTEVVRRERLAWIVIGVGINANFPRALLPPELHHSATTLHDELGGVAVDLTGLRADLVARLLEAVGTPGLTGETLGAARQRLFDVGQTVVTLVEGTLVPGTLLGLSDDGRPVLQTLDGPYSPPFGGELV